MRSLRILLLGLLLVPVGGGAARGGEEESARLPGVMETVIRRYEADETSLRRFYREPLSELRLTRLERFLDDWTARLEAIDLEPLGVDDRVDHALLRNHIARRRDEIRLQKARNAETRPLLGFATELLELDRRRWRPTEAPDGKRLAMGLVNVAARLAKARRSVEQAHGINPVARGDTVGLDMPKVSPVVAWRAAQALDRLGDLLKDWYAFHDGFDPGFAWWVKKPYDDLRKAMTAYATFLRESIAGARKGEDAPLIGDPIGADALRRALDREMIPHSPQELLDIAEAQFAWCERQGAAAATELGKDGWEAAVEHVKGLHKAPGAQAAMVAAQAQEAVAFLEQRELLTIPPLAAETWRLRMLGQHAQKTLPFAVYNDQHMLVAYAMSGMDHASKLMSMRGNNEHFTRIVTPHELIPGHHLQLFQAARHRPYRAMFRTPFLVEGWALHWEMLLWDLGWARGPEDRIGMLFWRMHRCARIIVTLKFHLGRMTPGQMIHFLVERVGLELDGATSEVRRYIAGAYGPLYQCAYMLGGLQMRALHHELVGNGSMSNRQFHDAVLRENSIPIALIRAALTGTRLERDAPAWRWPYEGVAPGSDGGRPR